MRTAQFVGISLKKRDGTKSAKMWMLLVAVPAVAAGPFWFGCRQICTQNHGNNITERRKKETKTLGGDEEDYDDERASATTV